MAIKKQKCIQKKIEQHIYRRIGKRGTTYYVQILVGEETMHYTARTLDEAREVRRQAIIKQQQIGRKPYEHKVFTHNVKTQCAVCFGKLPLDEYGQPDGWLSIRKHPETKNKSVRYLICDGCHKYGHKNLAPSKTAGAAKLSCVASTEAQKVSSECKDTLMQENAA